MTGRSPLRLAIVVAAAVALTGCATVSDNGIAARVNDAELTEEQMADLLREVAGDDAARASMVDANTVLNNFVLDQALRHDLELAGETPPETPDELTGATLQESLSLTVQVWQTTAPNPVSPERIQAKYQRGPLESNMACTAHILLADEATADDVLDQLADGAEFSELAAEYSIDPGSAASGGALPCDTTSNFGNQYISEYVEAALDAEVGEPVGPVASQFGFHVILVRPFDDLADGELDPVLAAPPVRFGFAVDGLDVFVNPRYGTFDAATGVVPLG